MDNNFSHGCFSLWDGAKEILADYPTATVSVLDMLNERDEGLYDATLDSMGLHMIVTDTDRKRLWTSGGQRNENHNHHTTYAGGSSYKRDGRLVAMNPICSQFFGVGFSSYRIAMTSSLSIPGGKL